MTTGILFLLLLLYSIIQRIQTLEPTLLPPTPMPLVIHTSKDSNFEDEIETGEFLSYQDSGVLANSDSVFMLTKRNFSSSLLEGQAIFSVSKLGLINIMLLENPDKKIYGQIQAIGQGKTRFLLSTFGDKLMLLVMDVLKNIDYSIDLGVKYNTGDELVVKYLDNVIGIGINFKEKTETDARVIMYSYVHNATIWSRDIDSGGKTFDLQGIQINPDNELLVVLGSIKSASYNNFYSGGFHEDFSVDSSRVTSTLVIAYSFKGGIQQWTKILGNELSREPFLDSCYQRGFLVVARKTYSGKYDPARRTNEIFFAKLNPENGELLNTQVLGGRKYNSRFINLDCNIHGTYILLEAKGKFYPHPLVDPAITNPSPDKVYSLPTEDYSSIVSWLDTDLRIMQTYKISDYDLEKAGKPKKLMLRYNSGSITDPFFISSKSSNSTKGFSFLRTDNNIDYFGSTQGCGGGCAFCATHTKSVCIRCFDGQFLFNGICKENCDLGFRSILETRQFYCQVCHPSCKSCSNKGVYSSKHHCDECNYKFFQKAALSNSYTDINDELPLIRMGCFCEKPFVNLRGTCSNYCKKELRYLSIDQKVVFSTNKQLNYECRQQCPEDKLPFKMYEKDHSTIGLFDTSDFRVLSSIRLVPISDPVNECIGNYQAAEFETGSPPISILMGPKLSSVPLNFTMGFWVRFKSQAVTMALFNGLGNLQVVFVANKIEWRIIDSLGATLTVTSTTNTNCMVNRWCYTSIACHVLVNDATNKYECDYIGVVMNSDSETEVGTIVQDGNVLRTTDMIFNDFDSKVEVGGSSTPISGSVNLDGYIKNVRLMRGYYGVEYMKISAFKLEYEYSNENIDNLLLLKFDKAAFAASDGSIIYLFKDSTRNFKEFSFSHPTNAILPKISGVTTFPKLCRFEEVYDCYGIHDWNITRLITDPKYLGKKSNFGTYFDIKPKQNYGIMSLSPGHIWDWAAGDKIGLFIRKCSTSSPYSIGLREFIDGFDSSIVAGSKSWGSIQPGSYYVCGYNSWLGRWFYLDQVTYVQAAGFFDYNIPFLVKKGNKMATKQTQMGYSNEGDIVFLAPDCSVFEDPSTNTTKYINATKFEGEPLELKIEGIESDGTFDTLSVGKCRLCLKPVFSKSVSKMMVTAIQGLYITIQKVRNYEKMTVRDIDYGSTIFAQTSLYNLAFLNPQQEFDDLDQMRLIPCSTPIVLDETCVVPSGTTVPMFYPNQYIYPSPLATAKLNIVKAVAGNPSTYCFCYHPAASRINQELVELGPTVITRKDGEAVKLTFDYKQATLAQIDMIPEILETSPSNSQQAINTTNSPTEYLGVTLNKDVVFKTAQDKIAYLIVVEYILSPSCFEDFQDLCHLTDTRKYRFSDVIQDNLSDNSKTEHFEVKDMGDTTFRVQLKPDHLKTLKHGFYSLGIVPGGILSKADMADPSFPTMFTNTLEVSATWLDFYVQDFTIKQREVSIPLTAASFVLEGLGLKYAEIDAWKDDLTTQKLSFSTKEIFVNFYIKNSKDLICDVYTSVVRLERKLEGRASVLSDTQILISDIKFDAKCVRGDLYANFIFVRTLDSVTGAPKLKITQRKDGILVSTIGCPSNCRECIKESSECQFCTIFGGINNLNYLEEGKCVAACSPQKNKFLFIEANSTVSTQVESQVTCVSSCKEGYFLDGTTCYRCDSSCKTCTNQRVNSCTSCPATSYIFEGTCIDQCPQFSVVNEAERKCEGSNNSKLKIVINTRSFSGSLMKKISEDFTGHIFYNGTATVNLEWKLYSRGEGQVKEMERNIQSRVFRGDDNRLGTLTTNILVEEYDYLFSSAEGVSLELKATAGDLTDIQFMDLKLGETPKVVSITASPKQPILGEANELIIQFNGNITQKFEATCTFRTSNVTAESDSFLTFWSDSFVSTSPQVARFLIPYLPDQVKVGRTAGGELYCVIFDQNSQFGEIKLQVEYLPTQSSLEANKQTLLTNIVNIGVISNFKKLSQFISFASPYFLLFKPPQLRDSLCHSNYDCFGGGDCANTIGDSKTCRCDAGRLGTNCQFNKIEHDYFKARVEEGFQQIGYKMREKAIELKDFYIMTTMLGNLMSYTPFVTIEKAFECVDFIEKLSFSDYFGKDRIKMAEEYHFQGVVQLVDSLLTYLNKEIKAISIYNPIYEGLTSMEFKMKREVQSGKLRGLASRMKVNFGKLVGTLIHSFIFNEKTSSITSGRTTLELISRKVTNLVGKSIKTPQNELYIPKNLFESLKSTIHPSGIVVMSVITWPQNLDDLRIENSLKVISEIKEIKVYGSDGSPLVLHDLESPVDFKIEFTDKNEIPIVPVQNIDCGVWNSSMIEQQRILYNKSILVSDLNLTATEAREAFNFTATYNLPTDYVTLSEETTKFIVKSGYDNKYCSPKVSTAGFFCSCNHFSTFGAFISNSHLQPTISPFRDTSLTLDLKIKEPRFKTRAFQFSVIFIIAYIILFFFFMCKTGDIFRRKQLLFLYLKYILNWKKIRFDFMVDLNKLSGFYQELIDNEVEVEVKGEAPAIQEVFQEVVKDAAFKKQNYENPNYTVSLIQETITHQVAKTTGSNIPVYLADNSEYMDSSNQRVPQNRNIFSTYRKNIRHNKVQVAPINSLNNMDGENGDYEGGFRKEGKEVDIEERGKMLGKKIVGFIKGGNVQNSRNQGGVGQHDAIKTNLDSLNLRSLLKSKKKTISKNIAEEVIKEEDEDAESEEEKYQGGIKKKDDYDEEDDDDFSELSFSDDSEAGDQKNAKSTKKSTREIKNSNQNLKLERKSTKSIQGDPTSSIKGAPQKKKDLDEEDIDEAEIRRREIEEETDPYKKKFFQMLDEFEKKYNKGILDNNLPDEITNFLSNVIPRELMAEKDAALLLNWGYGIEMLYELHEFGLRYIQKDKNMMLDFLTPQKFVWITNPITNLYFTKITFLTPPILRLNYLFICIWIHMNFNIMAISRLSDIPYSRDDYDFVYYDITNTHKTALALIVSMITNWMLGVIIFMKNDNLRIPLTTEDLKDVFYNLGQQIFLHVILSFLIFIVMSLMVFNSLSTFVVQYGRYYSLNWIWSTCFTMFLDFIVLDFLISYLAIRYKDTRVLGIVLDRMKKYKSLATDLWLTVSDEINDKKDYKTISLIFKQQKKANAPEDEKESLLASKLI